jgi:hypothetical protein
MAKDTKEPEATAPLTAPSDPILCDMCQAKAEWYKIGSGGKDFVTVRRCRVHAGNADPVRPQR